ncbi:hypothetical protein GS438_15240 [Rhodococcus hoagii]|nr:hypothetical protein [Prescottella equi]
MSAISTVAELEAIYGEQPPLTLEKSISVLGRALCRLPVVRAVRRTGSAGAFGRTASVVVGGDPGP